MGMFVHADDETEYDDGSLFCHTESEEDKVKELVSKATNLTYKQIAESFQRISEEIDISVKNLDKIISKIREVK